MVVGFTSTYTKVVSLNLAPGEVYSIQLLVINYVSDIRQLWFSPGTPGSSTNKTEILLKVLLITITIIIIDNLIIVKICF